MSPSFEIAVIGATGTVGETLVQLLEERDFPVSTLHLLASIESAGASVPFRGKNLRVRDVAEFDFARVRLAFFAAAEGVTCSFAPRALQAGCSVIDLSGALEQAVALVPGANDTALAQLQAPFALVSPSPSAVALASVLAPLRQVLALERVCVTACLSVSSRGREGVSELARQTAELLNARPLEPRFFDRQVAFNILAQPDSVDGEGHAQLERRLARELKEVLTLPMLDIAVTCVLVPVFFGDSLSVCIQSACEVDIAAVNAVLDKADALECVELGDYPTAVGDAVGQDVIYVGRVRKGLEDPSQLNLWITSDNVRKGAALNAIQSGELLIKHYL